MISILLLLAAQAAPVVTPPPAAPTFNSAVTLMAAPVALLMSSWDKDGDRTVSRAEYDAGVAASFRFADGDGDGAIRPIEFGHWAEAELGSPGALPGSYDFDRNADDRVSLTEFTAEFARRWTELDPDRDGRITRAELLTVGIPRGDRRGRLQEPGRAPR